MITDAFFIDAAEPAGDTAPAFIFLELPDESARLPCQALFIGITIEQGGTMPYVNIKVTKEGVTTEQKEELIQGVTQLLFDVLGKKPQTTYVIIDEVDTDNWGVGGETITTRRKREK